MNGSAHKKKGDSIANDSGASRRRLFDPASEKPYPLSRSKLELFLQCPRCFYLDRRWGLGRPEGYSYSLNLAVDTLLKREFDLYRGRGEPHALMRRQGIDAVPLRHPALEEWRDASRGVRVLHVPTQLTVFGAIDDAWLNPSGQLHVVDYKATSSATGGPITEVRNASYRRQVEIYQWLLRQNGFDVSDTAYFVYMNAEKGGNTFDGKLEFSAHIVPYEGNAGWVEEALQEARFCLMKSAVPGPRSNCEWCAYRSNAAKVEWPFMPIGGEGGI